MIKDLIISESDDEINNQIVREVHFTRFKRLLMKSFVKFRFTKDL